MFELQQHMKIVEDEGASIFITEITVRIFEESLTRIVFDGITINTIHLSRGLDYQTSKAKSEFAGKKHSVTNLRRY